MRSLLRGSALQGPHAHRTLLRRFGVTVIFACTMGSAMASASPVAPDTFGFGSGTVFQAQVKVDVCHRRKGANDFVLITIADRALAKHFEHGDGVVGGPVPGMEDIMVFDGACTPIVIAPPPDPILLTGGDVGEGYAPLPTTFGALNLGGDVAYTVQGVNFAVADPNIAVLSDGSELGGPVKDMGSSVNDNNLELMMGSHAFARFAPVVFTISGLTPGVQYQLDYFVGFTGSDREAQYSSQGLGSPVVTNFRHPGNGTAYDIRQFVFPDATGTIVGSVFPIDPPSAHVLVDGLSVTTRVP